MSEPRPLGKGDVVDVFECLCCGRVRFGFEEPLDCPEGHEIIKKNLLWDKKVLAMIEWLKQEVRQEAFNLPQNVHEQLRRIGNQEALEFVWNKLEEAVREIKGGTR